MLTLNNYRGILKRVAIVLITVAPLFSQGAFKPGYDVHASSIRPQWRGAQPGVWTMDYQAALNQAQTEGKWTVMLFSGMWWCPHCQPLEANVLEQNEWKDFAAEQGFYCTVLDFPYRDGESNFCWLWDEDYLAEAGLTKEEGQREIEARYLVQDRYAVPGAAVQSCASLAEPGTTNTYRRIGYPTILMIAPNGRVAGRFSVSKTFANPDYVLTRVRQIMEADEWDERDDYAEGATEIAEPQCEDTPSSAGEHTLGIVDHSDWFRFEVGVSAGYQTIFHFTRTEGGKAVPLQVSIFAQPTDASAVVTEVVDPLEEKPFTAMLKAGTWYLKVQPADTSLEEVVGYALSREYAMAPATVKFKTTSVAVRSTSATVDLVVQISGADKAADISMKWAATDGTAVYPADYALAEGVLSWGAGEVKKEKKITIPLVDPGVWKGDRSFTVKLSPQRHCEVAEAVANCVVTIKEARIAVPGTLSFDEAYQREKPILREAEAFSAIVTRTSGSDGCVTGTVSITDSALRNVVVTNLVWMHGDIEPKNFTYTFPAEEGVQKDRTGRFSLSVKGGARTGRVTAINFIRRDELVEQTFDEYNVAALQKIASQTGDMWFYGYDPSAREDGALFRSDVLTAKGSKLTLRVKGPSVLVFGVGLHRGAKASLTVGRTVLAETFDTPIEVAVPKTGQTLLLTCSAGEAGSFVSADVKVVPLDAWKLAIGQPFDKTIVPVSDTFFLQGVLATNELPKLARVPMVETFVGLGTVPRVAAVTNELTVAGARVDDQSVLAPLQIVGKNLQWRMDVVYTDAFGQRAVVVGNAAKVTFVEADSPQSDLAAGAPQNWTLTDNGTWVCPPLTVGVTADVGPIPLANIPEGTKAMVSVLNGRLPNGMKAVADERGVWLRGVPTVEGRSEFDLNLTAQGKVAGKNVTLKGASIHLDCVVEPLGTAVGSFNGLRMETTAGRTVAGLGSAQLTVGKTGSISGAFILNASNFTFRASAFTARDGELFDAACVTAKCGRVACVLSLKLMREHGEDVLQDVRLVTEGGDEYWLFRTDWKTPERKALLNEVIGSYTAALRAVAGEPAEVAPTAPGYLTVTVKADGTAQFAVVDATGKSFSGSSPVMRMQDCCNGTGWMWVFYVSTAKAPYQAGGLVAIEPDSTNPSVKYLYSADDAGIIFSNGDPKSVFAHEAWRLQTTVVGGSYDKNLGFAVVDGWKLADDLPVFSDAGGRDGTTGFRLVWAPAAGELVLRKVTDKKVAWEESAYDVSAPSLSTTTGTYSYRLSLVYLKKAQSKVVALTVKGVYVQNSLEGSFWSGACPFRETAPYTAENGRVMTYAVDTYLSVELK